MKVILLVLLSLFIQINSELIISYPDGSLLETRMSLQASKYETCSSGAYIILRNTDNFNRLVNVTIRLASQRNYSNIRFWNVLSNVQINASSIFTYRLANYVFFDVPSKPPSSSFFRFDAIGNFNNTPYDYGYLSSVLDCDV